MHLSIPEKNNGDRRDRVLLFSENGRLTHCTCILVESSNVIFWTSLLVILGVSGLFVAFVLFLMENSVSKQCRP